MVSSDVVGIGSEYFVVYLSCACICSADYIELPVLLYQVSTSMFGISHVVQNEVLVLGLLVVVYRIPYSSCM